MNGVESKDRILQRVAHSEGSVVRNEHGQYQQEYVLRDHLGNTRVTFSDLNNDDEISEKEEIIQLNNYYAFGLNMEGNWNGKDGANKLQYNGKELNDDFGLNWNDYGARFYDPAAARWWTIDPLAEKYGRWSPYNYTLNNPIRFIDPDGQSVESTDVRKNANGTYDVVGGKLDNDNGIYLQKSDGTRGELIAYSATPESFYFCDEQRWVGHIDPNDPSGRNFLNTLQQTDPNLVTYMANAYGGQKYDFKRTNGTASSVFTNPNDFYRGMPILGEENGKPIFASARDIGNIGAGIAAGSSGIPWLVARAGFNTLQSYQQGELSTEGTCTQYAERLGYNLGTQTLDAKNAQKAASLPGHGNLKYQKKEPKATIIKRNEL